MQFDIDVNQSSVHTFIEINKMMEEASPFEEIINIALNVND